MRVLVVGSCALLFLTVAVAEPEVVFKGKEIELAKPFLCGGRMPEGRYALEVVSDTENSSGPVLKVSKGDKTLCELAGKPADGTYDELKPKKVRVFTRVNAEAKALQIDLVVPPELRERFPNRTFLLPIAGGH